VTPVDPAWTSGHLDAATELIRAAATARAAGVPGEKEAARG
jgi:hypothetical protein